MKKITFVCFLILSSIFNENLYSKFNPDTLEARVSRILKKYVDTNHAGLVIGVIRKEGSTPILSRRYSFGHIRHDTNSPRPDSLTIFHIGPVTKTFTATILSMLIQQGDIRKT